MRLPFGRGHDRRATARHEAARAALARRMDEPLDAETARLLETHLTGCPLCRMAAEGYEDDRRRLHALPIPEPPRDLWARTATALDREVARHDRRPAAVSLGSLLALTVVLVLVGVRIGGNPASSPLLPAATPFAVTPQPLAFLTREGDRLALFQTEVSEVCPAAVIDCPQASPTAELFVDVGSGIQPSGLAVGVDGRLLITGLDDQGHAMFGIVRIGAAGVDGASGASATPSGAGGLSSAIPSSTPGTVPTASPGTSTPTAGSSATETTGPRPTTGHPPRSTPAPSTSAASGSPPPSGATPSIIPASHDVQPILSDVIQTGAPAAWSPDGSMLAFSAMPADGSRGPDIYLWRTGDKTAQALTHDHRSSFASWVGRRILVSRTTASTAAGPHASAGQARSTAGSPAVTADPSGLHTTTVLIDPRTGASKVVPTLEDAWLPTVDPTGRFVAYWVGAFAQDGPTIAPITGQLWIGSWPAIDPYAAAPSTSNSGSPTPSASSSASPTPTDTPSPASSATASPVVSGTAPLPLDPAAGPVTSWRIRWADDGQALGLWLGADSQTQIGQMTVLAPPDPVTGEVHILMAPTSVAADMFAMGLDRVAWVVPLGADAGELRVATWGPLGAGVLRLRELDSSQGVPAF